MYYADRFIPQRDVNYSQIVGLYSLSNSDYILESEAREIYKRNVYRACNGFEYKEDRRVLFPFPARKVGATKAPLSPCISSNYYQQILANEARHHIPGAWKTLLKEADRVFNAPNYSNDFYSSVLDASQQGVEQIAVALGNGLYSYVPSTEQIVRHEDATDGSCYSMVRWLNRPGRLLTGDTASEIYEIDVEKRVTEWHRRFKPEHLMPLCAEPVGMHSMVVGFKAGALFQLDSREHARAHLIGRCASKQSVCALRLHANNTYLASGSNDNVIRLWDVRQPRQEVLRIDDHLAAVKALAWSPVSDDLLFSGGGSADRTIKVTSLKAQKVIMSEASAKSQITGIHISEDGKRLASCHGYDRNSVIVWQFNGSLKQVAELSGHEDRILCSTMLQDRTTLLTASADETVRFWNVFAKVKAKMETNSEFKNARDYKKHVVSKMYSAAELR